MRKLFICLLFFVCIFTYAEEFTLFKGEYTANNFFGTEDCAVEIRYDDVDSVHYLFFRRPVTGTPIWIALKENDFVTLRNNLQKYIEWEKIAREQKTVITKELPDSKIAAGRVIEGDDGGRKDCEEGLLTLAFVFDNKNTSDSRLHILSNKVITKDWYGELSSIQIANVAFTKPQIQSLLNGIQADTLRKERERLEKAKLLFN
jgi:hypothetical protein